MVGSESGIGGKAIVAASVGSSCRDAICKAVEPLEKKICTEFPDYRVVRAFTGERIISIIKQLGDDAQSTDSVLERLIGEGYGEAVIGSAHIFRGREYDKLCTAANKYSGYFSKLSLTCPLIDSVSDIERVFLMFLDAFRDESSAIILLRHKSAAESDKLFEMLEPFFEKDSYRRIVIADTGDGYSFESTVKRIHRGGYKNAVLAPLMLTSGMHVMRDMIGNEDSLKNRLEARGISVEPIIKGLGEYETVQKLYIEHLYKCITE